MCGGGHGGEARRGDGARSYAPLQADGPAGAQLAVSLGAASGRSPHSALSWPELAPRGVVGAPPGALAPFLFALESQCGF